MLTVIVTITGRFVCSVKRYCENNGDIYIYAVIPVIVTITGRPKCSVNIYSDNNGKIYM